MSVLSIVMLIASIFFLYLVIRNINKNNILFEQAFMWIVISLVMIIISIFVIPGYFAGLLGFELTSNFLLSLAIFFLLVIAFLQTMTLSKQKEQIKHLVQELSILKSHVVEKEEKNEG